MESTSGQENFMADYLCVDRAAMSAELSKLQKEGKLKTNRNHFELYESV